MKKYSREAQTRMCTGKRRYPTQGDALNAALIVGVERERKAYLCPLCHFWHLTTAMPFGPGGGGGKADRGG